MRKFESDRGDRLVSELVRDDPDLLDIVEEFVDGLSTRITELKQAFDDLDWERLQVLAHRLKGAGGSYGYPELTKLAAEMERDFRARRGNDFETWVRELESLTAAAHAGLRAE